MKRKGRKSVRVVVVFLVVLFGLAAAALIAFYSGLMDADFGKGLAFNLQGAAAYAFTKKAEFHLGENSINPIYPIPAMYELDYSVKDACIVEKDGELFLFASAFFEENGRMYCHVIGARGEDLTAFSEPFMIWGGEDLGAYGLASPEVVSHGDTYYMFYNTWGDKPGESNRLLYAVSNDLVHWEKHRPLAQNLTEGLRAIDAAGWFYNEKVYLVYKENQKVVFAVSDAIDGEFRMLSNDVYGWYENYQYLALQDGMYLLGTNRPHLPVLMKMNGDPEDDASWASFRPVLRLIPPRQAFNTNERANAASIFRYRGEYYLLYAGRTQSRTHLGRGDNKLGAAKSITLDEWDVL